MGPLEVSGKPWQLPPSSFQAAQGGEHGRLPELKVMGPEVVISLRDLEPQQKF